MAPSDPPETRMGCTGCHARAIWVRRINILVLGEEEGHTADFFLVSTQDDPLLHGANVEYSHGLVARCTCEQVPMGSPCEGLNSVLVLMARDIASMRISLDDYEMRTAW